MKREGRWVAHLMIRYITQTEDSNCNLANMVTQLKFLTDLQERLKDPENTIIDDMKKIKSIITDSSNFRLFVDVDVNRIPHDSWKLLETFQSLPVDKRPRLVNFILRLSLVLIYFTERTIEINSITINWYNQSIRF